MPSRFSRLWARFARFWNADGVAAYRDARLWHQIFGEYDDGKIRITESNALTVSDALKCIRVRAETFAILPKKVYSKQIIAGRQGRREAPEHPLYRLIHSQPNPLMTSYEFFEAGSAHLDTWGNWYSYIDRPRNSARPRGLWLLCPHRVRITVENGQRWYYVSDENGVESRFYPDEILHVHGLSYDGYYGYSPVRLQMNALGAAKATESYGFKFFTQGARLSGLLKTKDATPIPPDVKKALLESFREYHSGAENAHKIGLLEGGLDFQALTMPNNEAQFLETRKFQRSEIAGIYRVPPHKIGDLDKATFSNIEQQEIGFVTDAIQPLVERVEQAFERALLSPAEQDKFFIGFEFKGLLRGDTAARTAHYREMINMGVYTQNDVLQEEDMPPFEGGDTHWMQLNMAPIEQLLKMASQANEEADPPAAMEDSIRKELQARFRNSYQPILRDCVGRVMSRKVADRERSAPSIFRFALLGVLIGMNVTPENAFIDDYLNALGKRAPGWEESQADEIAVDELNRAIDAVLGRSRS